MGKMRRLMKAIERNSNWLIRAEKYVWSYMIYECEDCGVPVIQQV